MPAELAVKLKAFCQRQGLTLFMLLLAGFDVLLSRYSGQEDVLVGTPIANRNRSETEGLIGFFVNTLVFRAKLGSAPNFRDLLHQVRENALGAYGHQDLPFEMLVEELRPQRDLSRSPFFQVLLSVQTLRRELPVLEGFKLSLIERELATAKFDLTLTFTETENDLSWRIGYSRDLFEGATIERLAGHLTHLLAGAVADPQRRWSELPLLSPTEQEQLLVEWNDTGVTPPAPWVGLQELFAAQVASRPEALAVTDGERELTYAALDRRAGRLSRVLRRVGVGLESRVALCMERSVDLIVGLVAALKAGGAFAVLDPAQPARRLRQILDDAAPAAVLTHAATGETVALAWEGAGDPGGRSGRA